MMSSEYGSGTAYAYGVHNDWKILILMSVEVNVCLYVLCLMVLFLFLSLSPPHSLSSLFTSSLHLSCLPSLCLFSRMLPSLPASYPCVPVVFEIEANTSGSFSYKDADDLFDLLMKESLNRVGAMMIFDLVTIAQDYMPGNEW